MSTASNFIKPILHRLPEAPLCIATLLLLVVASASLGFAQLSEDENGKIVLDQKVLVLKCRPGAKSRSGSSSESFVVKAQTKLKEHLGREYKYTADYGKIVIDGNKAEWDLTGERPGTYRLSVSVLKKGQNVAQYDADVKIEEGDCITDCECPWLTISRSSETVKNGENVTFTAGMTGGATVSYTWTVKNGEIIEGQGTAEIKVRAKRNAALDTVTATVSIGGLDPGCNCTTEASASATIIL